WSHADALGIDADLFHHSGVHVHVPAGAVPKDGPSAGVALATALTSLYAGVRHVILPRDNEMDLRELPDNVRDEMQFTLAERIEDVLSAALPGVAERL